MAHQSLHLRLRNKPGASPVVRCQFAEASLVLDEASVLYNTLEYAKVFVHFIMSVSRPWVLTTTSTPCNTVFNNVGNS